MKQQSFRRILGLAGLLAIGATSRAALFDAQIAIDKALASSALTVRYQGVHASTAELKVNGVSIATRTLNFNNTSGESDFNLDPQTLVPGANKIEIILFDRKGKIVGKKVTTVSANSNQGGPVFFTTPKMGDTLQGPVEIKVGFGRSFSSPFVSFFVDNSMKSMSNNAPFDFIWDTTQETNGWHSIQSILVDNSTTEKTPLLKVFINNPGGLTDRKAQPEPRLVQKAVVTATQKVNPTKVTTSAVATTVVTPIEPSELLLNPMEIAKLTGERGLEAQVLSTPMSAGAKHLMPTGERLISKPTTTVRLKNAVKLVALRGIIGSRGVTGGSTAIKSAVKANFAINALRYVMVTSGTKIPNIPNFSIFMNGEKVPFDIQPRVDNGVPMTPFRYLLQQDGGKVHWENLTKTVTAQDRTQGIWFQIGNINAKVNNQTLKMETVPYIDGSRTIVPLSFIHDALKVDVQYDKNTGHVLISRSSK